MAQELRFDGKVVIITGAGNGLGRSHAMLFGSRGAKVVVNDLGGSAFGDGKSASAADKVVEAIKAVGGEAVANYDSVENGDAIVKTAIDHYGRVDIVVNNAGILRDVSFHKMTEQDWDLIFRVHVLGAFRVTHAAWPYMREQKYGRVIFTSSAAGIYGNFGQANYGAAKLAQLGMANTLAVEGRKAGILVNTIAPIAASRLTETVMPKEVLESLAPEAVSPLVAWLSHESCEENGGVFEVGGGYFSKLRWQRTKGKLYRIGRVLTPELVRDNFEEITRFDADAKAISSIQESTGPVFENIQKGKSKGGNQYIDVDAALGYEMAKVKTSYDENDLAVYVLGIGAGRDPLSPFDLSLVYEGFGGGFKAFPTYGVIPALNTMIELAKQGKNAPGLNYGFDRILHGEQYLELKRPLPTHGTLEHTAKIKEIWDKGKGAVVVTSVTTTDEDGDPLVYNEISSFVRGAGGWGGDRGPSVEVNVPPERKPDAVVEEKTDLGQALLYRQTGDINPLHADPGFAKAFGFDKPILHGLCTFGFAVRHVVKAYAPESNPNFFKSVKVRFADSVFPGETLVTEMWKESPTRIVFRTKVKERDAVVISNAAVELFAELPKPKPKKAAAVPAAGASAKVTVEPRDVFAVMHDYILANPEASKKAQTVFGFKLKDPDAYFTVDAKNGTGVHEGETEKPNCTMELATADFLALTRGEANPQKLFSTGKLKLSGDMMAAMKLDFLSKLDVSQFQKKADARGGAGGGAPAEEAGPLTAADIMAAIGAHLAKNPDLPGKVGKVFGFELSEPDSVWTVDLKGKDGVREGATAAHDCTFKLSEANLLAMVRGEENPQKLFSSGKLKLGGDMMAAMKLGFLSSITKDDLEAARKARGGTSAPANKPAAAKAEAKTEKPNGAATAPAFIAAVREGLPKVKNGASGKLVLRVLSPDATFTFDFAAGTVSDGAEKGVETLVTVKDEDLSLLRGKAPLASLFQKGIVRVDGPMAPMHQLALLAKV